MKVCGPHPNLPPIFDGGRGPSSAIIREHENPGMNPATNPEMNPATNPEMNPDVIPKRP